MRKTVLVLASVALAMLVASGVAWAANISCPTGANGLCVGTTNDDTLTGTPAFDNMKGLAGNDTLYGKGWGDTLTGDGGNDTLRGEAGNDTLYGDTQDIRSAVRGSDHLLGGWGDDELRGGPGNDRVSGGPGRDELDGQARRATGSNYDTMHGNDGNDSIHSGYGERYGDGGDDFVSAYEGNAWLFGGSGDDQMNAGTTVSKDVGFTQVATGGPGQDRFAVSIFVGSPGSRQPPDEITYQAVDGEHDTITCVSVKKERVIADPLDTFSAQGWSGYWKAGRQYCDFVRIVK